MSAKAATVHKILSLVKTKKNIRRVLIDAHLGALVAEEKLLKTLKLMM